MTGSTASNMELSFGSPQPGEPEKLAELLGTTAFKRVIWDWQFGRAPERIQPVTAYHGQELVGFNGAMPVDVVFDGDTRPAAWSCDFIVKPECRRHGVGGALKHELDRRSSFLLTQGTSEAAATVLARSGWQPGQGPRSYVRLQRARGPRDRIRRALQGLTSLAGRVRSRAADVSKVTFVDELPGDELLDCLWADVAGGYSRCVVRDAAYLRWRYAGHPLARYRYLCAWRNQRLVALAVVRVSATHAVFVDYIGPAVGGDLKNALVAALLEASGQCDTLECTTSDLELSRALVRHGFLPTRSPPLRFFVRVTTEPVPADCATGWFLMGGDSDGELLAAARDASWTVRKWTEEEFAAGREGWERLLEQSAADRLFMGWDWQYSWWKHFSRRHGLELRIAALYDVRGELAGLAPCFWHRLRTPGGLHVRRLEPIGNLWAGAATMRTEYVGPILRRDCADEAGRQLAAHLLGDFDWDDFTVQDWDAGAPGVRQFDSLLKTRALVLEHTHRDADEARYVPLVEGFDTYVASLSANARRSMIHRRSYLQSLGKVRIEHARPDQVDEYFTELNRLHALRWGAPVFTGHRLEFHQDLATRMAGQDRLRFSRLSVDGVVLSVLYHLRGGRREYNLQMGFDDRLHASKMSLGLLHLGYAIETAASEGMEAVDLLAGPGKQGLFKQRVAPCGHPFVRRQHVRSTRARAVFGTSHALHKVARWGRQAFTERIRNP
jgi:CelD/BcsL family acetyltransferase involved in cellulose biosynthesis